MKTLSRILLRLVVLVFVLAVLMILAGIEENWRGVRDWNAFVCGHQARGERIDFQPLIPPPVPGDRNFAMTPLLKNNTGMDNLKSAWIWSTGQN